MSDMNNSMYAKIDLLELTLRRCAADYPAILEKMGEVFEDLRLDVRDTLVSNEVLSNEVSRLSTRIEGLETEINTLSMGGYFFK